MKTSFIYNWNELIRYKRTERRETMELTEVKVRKVINTTGKLVAAATIILDDEFVINDIKIINGKRGLFIVMPSRGSVNNETGKYEFRDIAYPLHSKTREKIHNAIMSKFNEVMKVTNDIGGYTWDIQ